MRQRESRRNGVVGVIHKMSDITISSDSTGYQCKNYSVKELVPPETYKIYGEKCWEFIDSRMCRVLDLIVWYFEEKPIINNWHAGGQYKYSGFRPRTFSISKSGECSPHRFGRAFDIKFPKYDMRTAYNEIVKEYRIFWQITRIESGVVTIPKNYIHIDNCNHKKINGIYIFKP